MPSPTPKPCPFCGARGRKHLLLFYDQWGGLVIRCDTCSCLGPGPEEGASTQREAIDAWNTRVSDDC
jgi:hypothetical protein